MCRQRSQIYGRNRAQHAIHRLKQLNAFLGARQSLQALQRDRLLNIDITDPETA